MGGPRKPAKCTIKIFAHDGTAFLITREYTRQKWRVYRADVPSLAGTMPRTYDASGIEIDFTALCNLKYGGIKRIVTETKPTKVKRENWRWEESSGCLYWQF